MSYGTQYLQNRVLCNLFMELDICEIKFYTEIDFQVLKVLYSPT